MLGVVAQLVWSEAPSAPGRVPGLPPTVALATLDTPPSDFIRAHVPSGQPIVYVTHSHDNANLYYFFRLSTALVPRNAVWWAVPAPATSVTDWWQDVSGGPGAIRRLAARIQARYVSFTGEEVPTGLGTSAVWRLDGGFAVAELSP
jgi:hypothetical protein